MEVQKQKEKKERYNQIREFFKERQCVWLALYVPLFTAAFFMVERLVPESVHFWATNTWIDAYIPFNEHFVILYDLWFPVMMLAGLFLLVADPLRFKYFMYYIMIGFTFCLIFYLIVPNGQTLRPDVFPRENFYTDMVKWIYDHDTCTNVLPSMHVYGIVGAALAFIELDELKTHWKWVKPFTVIMAILITASTCYIKQHTVLDIAAALALSAIVYAIVFIFIDKKQNES